MTASRPRGLSKTLLLKGLQCPRALWLAKHPPAFEFPPQPDREARYDAGHRVGILAQQLFPDGRPLGRQLVAQGLSFEVVGVLAPQRDSFFFGGGSAVVPISVARDRLFPEAALGPVQVSEATVYLEDVTRLDETQQAITALLRARHKLGPEQGAGFSFQNFGEFAEANNKLELKIGVMDGKSLDLAAIKSLSSLPSREVLLAKVLSAMNGVPTGFVRTLSGVPQKFLNLLTALREQKEAA